MISEQCAVDIMRLCVSWQIENSAAIASCDSGTWSLATNCNEMLNVWMHFENTFYWVIRLFFLRRTGKWLMVFEYRSNNRGPDWAGHPGVGFTGREGGGGGRWDPGVASLRLAEDFQYTSRLSKKSPEAGYDDFLCLNPCVFSVLLITIGGQITQFVVVREK